MTQETRRQRGLALLALARVCLWDEKKTSVRLTVRNCALPTVPLSQTARSHGFVDTRVSVATYVDAVREPIFRRASSGRDRRTRDDASSRSTDGRNDRTDRNDRNGGRTHPRPEIYGTRGRDSFLAVLPDINYTLVASHPRFFHGSPRSLRRVDGRPRDRWPARTADPNPRRLASARRDRGTVTSIEVIARVAGRGERRAPRRAIANESAAKRRGHEAEEDRGGERRDESFVFRNYEATRSQRRPADGEWPARFQLSP